MNRWVLLASVGLAGGAFGFVAGVLLWLAVTGLESPGAMPVAQLTGAGLVAGLALGLAAGIEATARLWLAAGTTLVGLLLGFAVRRWGDLEWAIAAAAALVFAAVAVARSMAPSD